MMMRASYAVDVEPGTGLIIKPSRAESRPVQVEFLRVRWVADIKGVTPWLRSLGIQHIVHTDSQLHGSPALTLYLRRELHTVAFGDVLVLPPGPGSAAHRMRVVPAAEFDQVYAEPPA